MVPPAWRKDPKRHFGRRPGPQRRALHETALRCGGGKLGGWSGVANHETWENGDLMSDWMGLNGWLNGNIRNTLW